MTDGLLDLALEVAREAAALVRERRRGAVSVAATKSSDIDIVTQVDRDSEDLIRSRIRAARPDDGFLGEEGHDEPGTSGVRWVVDPIDGTVNFLYDLPQYAVSVAAEEDGVVVAGVVVNVASGTEYTALRRTTPEGGSTVESCRDGEPIRVRGEAPLAQQAGRDRLPLRRRDPRAPGGRRGPVAAAHPRHPADGVVRAGPLPRRRGCAGRLRRGGRHAVGPRGGRPGRRGRRGHASS